MPEVVGGPSNYGGGGGRVDLNVKFWYRDHSENMKRSYSSNIRFNFVSTRQILQNHSMSIVFSPEGRMDYSAFKWMPKEHNVKYPIVNILIF